MVCSSQKHVQDRERHEALLWAYDALIKGGFADSEISWVRCLRGFFLMREGEPTEEEGEENQFHPLTPGVLVGRQL